MNPKADIFIAARDKVQIETLQQLFRGLGQWSIAATTDAQKAHVHLKGSRPETILICDGLKGVDAASFIQTLRRDPEVLSRKGHILFVGPREFWSKALANGAHACLSLPVSLADLMKALASLKSDTRPFVDHPVYVGPCRRVKRTAGRDVPRRRRADEDDLSMQLAQHFEVQRKALSAAAAAARATPEREATERVFQAVLSLERAAAELGDTVAGDAISALAEGLARRLTLSSKAAAMIEEFAAALAHLRRMRDPAERELLAVMLIALASRTAKLISDELQREPAAMSAAARGAK